MAKPTDREEEIGKMIVHSAFQVHKALGPGLLERVYEICLAHELTKLGLNVSRQVNIPIIYDGISFEDGLRVDMMAENCIIIETKAVLEINPVWQAQILSHLKLTGHNLGYLINFNVTLIKDGIKRFVRKD